MTARKIIADRLKLALTCIQWLPKPATIQFPDKRRALRASWSPEERENRPPSPGEAESEILGGEPPCCEEQLDRENPRQSFAVEHRSTRTQQNASPLLGERTKVRASSNSGEAAEIPSKRRRAALNLGRAAALPYREICSPRSTTSNAPRPGRSAALRAAAATHVLRVRTHSAPSPLRVTDPRSALTAHSPLITDY